MGVVVCLPLLNHGPCAAPNTYKLASFPFFAPAFVYSSPFLNLFQALMGKHFPKVFQPTSNGCKLRSEGFSPCLCHGTLASPKLWSVHNSKHIYKLTCFDFFSSASVSLGLLFGRPFFVASSRSQVVHGEFITHFSADFSRL